MPRDGITFDDLLAQGVLAELATAISPPTQAATAATLTEPTMRHPPLDPPVANEAPTSDVLTGYDQEHLVTYLRLLDAEADEADWAEVARIVLHIDPGREPMDDGARVPASAARWCT